MGMNEQRSLMNIGRIRQAVSSIVIMSLVLFLVLICACNTVTETISCNIELESSPESIHLLYKSAYPQRKPPYQSNDPEWEPILDYACKDVTFGDYSSYWFRILNDASEVNTCILPQNMPDHINERMHLLDFSTQNLLIVNLGHSSMAKTNFIEYAIDGNIIELSFEEKGPEERTSDCVPSQYVFTVNFK